MNDTSEDMRRMQRHLHLQLSEKEKWERGFEMMENGKSTLIAALKLKFPGDTEDEIFVKMVRKLYRNHVSAEFLDGFEKRYWEWIKEH